MLMWFGIDVLNLMVYIFFRKLTNRGHNSCNQCFKRDKQDTYKINLSWVEISVRRKIHKLSLMYKIVYNLS